MLPKRITWLALILLLATTLAWWQRVPLLAWFFTRQLAGATVEEQPSWASRVAELDEAAVPALTAWLSSPQDSICANIEAGLLAIVASWPGLDERAGRLASRLHQGLAGWELPARRTSLHVLAALLRRPGDVPPDVSRTAATILTDMAGMAELRGATLLLASAVSERTPPGPCHDICRRLTREGLHDPDPQTRVAAAQMLLGGSLRQERALLAMLVPLLRDASPVVRRAAIVVLAPARAVVGEDAFLPLLHDADPDVQQVCEAALRSRGLDENHLRLARLISDDNPAARLRVLQHLGRQADLDLGVWLRRLSQDRAPAVRAAAIRAAGLFAEVDLNDRLREMAAADPSETVRQNAVYYLRERQRRAD